MRRLFKQVSATTRRAKKIRRDVSTALLASNVRKK
jgi:hypothetical protein